MANDAGGILMKIGCGTTLLVWVGLPVALVSVVAVMVFPPLIILPIGAFRRMAVPLGYPQGADSDEIDHPFRRCARRTPERRLSGTTISGQPPKNSKARTCDAVQSARVWVHVASAKV